MAPTKRARDTDGVGAPFPMAAIERGRLVLVGGVYVDVLNEVPTYPAEDSSCRALSSVRRRGGNAGNSCEVLARLLRAHAPACRASWMGVVPSVRDPDSSFALAALGADGVDTSLVEEVGGEGVGQPTSFITLARDTGSRTIVSTRRGCRELSPAHFARMLERADAQAAELGPLRWCHLECREMPAVRTMAEAFRAARGARALGGGGGARVLSLEVEKPQMVPAELLPVFALCDAIFLSREFLEKNSAAILAAGGAAAAAAAGAAAGGAAAQRGAPAAACEGAGGEPGVESHLALRCLRALSAQLSGCRALWLVGWGSSGAYALDSASGEGLHQPPFPPERVVDSVGAGDSFIGAAVFALARGAGPREALRCACAVAGAKVGQVGFAGLEAAATFGAAAAPPSPSPGGAR